MCVCVGGGGYMYAYSCMCLCICVRALCLIVFVHSARQVQQGIVFLNTFGGALHKAGLRVGIEEKSTFINGVPARDLITNSSVDSVVLWYVIVTSGSSTFLFY